MKGANYVSDNIIMYYYIQSC